MIKLGECQKVLSAVEESDSYFLKQHFYIEGFLKRLLFIGLRLNDVQYNMAEEVIIAYHEPLEKMIERAWTISGFDYKNDVVKFGAFKDLEGFFVNYTAKYRNYRVHGIYDEIEDPDLLRLLTTINYRYYKICNEYISHKGKPSVFDKPIKWGAKIGKEETILEVYSRIFKGVKKKDQKYSRNDIEKWLSINQS